MTDYVKLPKTCSDHAVGFQSVNQAIDNNLALFERLDKRHAVGTRSIDPILGPGRHDDVLIARTVADFKVVPGPAGTQLLFSLLSGPQLWTAPVELATGQWRIDVTSRGMFNAVATIKGATAGNARYATCYRLTDSVSPFVIVSTWNVTGGVLAAYDFSLVIWAEVVI